MILVILVSIVLYAVLPWSGTMLRVLYKLAMLPLLVGICYEILKWAGRSNSLLARAVSVPGLWLQHLTTFEPEDDMIEVAIAAVTPYCPKSRRTASGNAACPTAAGGHSAAPGCAHGAGCSAGRRRPDADYDARELLRIAAGKDPRLLFDPLTRPQAECLAELAAQRMQRCRCNTWQGVGLSGVDLQSRPRCALPRADSEVVCETAIELLQQMGKPEPRVLDLCAGTGRLGIGIRHFVPSASVTCVEKSPQALQYLQANVHGTGVQAKAADVLQYWRELMPQSVQLIISNPPYLTGAEMQALMPETAHEPAMALDGGTDGLDFYRAIAAHYRDIVCPGGWLVFEIGCAQRADVMEICRQNGWQQVQARKDYGGNDRVVYAQQVK